MTPMMNRCRKMNSCAWFCNERGETMKFKLELRMGYTKAEKNIEIPLENYDRWELEEWMDAGYEVVLTAIPKEKAVTEDDF